MIEPQTFQGSDGDDVLHQLPYQYGGMLIDAVPTHQDVQELADILPPCGLTDRSQCL